MNKINWTMTYDETNFHCILCHGLQVYELHCVRLLWTQSETYYAYNLIFSEVDNKHFLTSYGDCKKINCVSGQIVYLLNKNCIVDWLKWKCCCWILYSRGQYYMFKVWLKVSYVLYMIVKHVFDLLTIWWHLSQWNDWTLLGGNIIKK